MKKRIATLGVVLVLAVSSPLVAQSPGGHPAVERGNRSIFLGVSSNPSIGYWTRSTDRSDLGMDLFLGGMIGETNDHIAIEVTPALKRYLGPNGVLAPYTYFGIPLGYSRSHRDNVGAPESTADAYSVGAAFGFGFDWLPVRQVSIGGHIGLSASYQDQNDIGARFALGTHSSGVRVHLYF